MLCSSRDGRPFGHNRHVPKIEGRVCAPFGGAGSPCNTICPGPRPIFVPSGILSHPAVWPQQTWAENWGLCPLEGVELGPVACAEDYLHTKWYLDASSRLATTDISQKLGAVPLFGGGARSPSSTMWPAPRPTFIPSGISIHPAVWPQGHGPKTGGCAPFWGRGSWVPI